MKKAVFVALIIIASMAAIVLLQNKNINSEQKYLKFFTELDGKNLNFKLYDYSTTPFSRGVIETFNQSYNDLIELGRDPKYKIKISQIEHEKAMRELELFYKLLKSIAECNDELSSELLNVCRDNANKIKSANVINYLKQ